MCINAKIRKNLFIADREGWNLTEVNRTTAQETVSSTQNPFIQNAETIVLPTGILTRQKEKNA